MLFYWNRDSVIIRNRLPNIVYIEAFLTMMTAIVNSIDSDSNVNIYVPCPLLYGTYGPVASISVTLIFCRISYVYAYLLSSVKNVYVSRLFWENNKLQTKRLAFIIVIMLVGTWVNSFVYYATLGYWGPPTKAINCKIDALYFAEAIFVLLTIFQLIFALSLLFRRAFDQIGMCVEMIGYGLSSFTTNIIYFCIYGSVASDAVFISCILNIFFSLYFPNIVVFRHNHKKQHGRFNIMNSKRNTLDLDNIIDPRIHDLCKQFLCEENSHFLTKFPEYKNGVLSYENLLSLFISYGSMFELNIPHDLRISVLNSTTVEEQKALLDKVHEEVLQMIKDNIMPYVE